MSPRLALLWAAAFVLSAIPASAQVTFTTTTYSGNNLWFQNGGPDSQLRVDLNGDGREDFVSDNTASWASGCSGSFAVALSTGDGQYAAPVCYTLPAGVGLYFAAGDFYGTGTMDLAVTNEQGEIYIYRNQSGNGELTLANTISLVSEAVGLVASDVNHDGHIDLVYDVGNSSTGDGGSLYTLLGNGDGTFTAGPTTPFT